MKQFKSMKTLRYLIHQLHDWSLLKCIDIRWNPINICIRTLFPVSTLLKYAYMCWNMLINVYTAKSDKIRWQNVLIFVRLCWNLLTYIKFFETAFPDNDTQGNYRNLTAFVEIQWWVENTVIWVEKCWFLCWKLWKIENILKCIGICWNTLKCVANCWQSVDSCWKILIYDEIHWHVEILNFLFVVTCMFKFVINKYMSISPIRF